MTLPRWQSLWDPVLGAQCCDRTGGDWQSVLSPKPRRILFAREESLTYKGQLGRTSQKDVKLIGGNGTTGRQRAFMCLRARGSVLALSAILKHGSNSSRRIIQAYITAPLLCCSLHRQCGDKHGKMPRERNPAKNPVSFPTSTPILRH